MNGDFAPVGADDALGDGQAQAVALYLTIMGGIHPVEPVENALLGFRGNGGTGVEHPEDALVALCFQRNTDSSPLLGILFRVAQQDHQELLDHFLVSGVFYTIRDLHFHGFALIEQRRFKGQRHFHQGPAQVKFIARRLYRSFFHAGQGQQILDQAVRSLHFGLDILERPALPHFGGQYVGTEKMQVCLSFAYGDGKHTSCENTVQAVSNLLYGADIGTYFCMDWADIGTLNDLVGGVEVPEYDDNFQPTGQMVTLSGDAVYKYLRSRDIEVLGSSVNRMDRQVNYLKAFAAKIAESARADITTPVRLFNELNNVSINTMDASKITYLTTVFLNGGAQIEFHELTGELGKGEEYAEMYLDDKTTYEMLLKLFYKKK